MFPKLTARETNAWRDCGTFSISDARRKSLKGILDDNNVIGQVAFLVGLMQAEPWADFWKELGLVLRRFEEAGEGDQGQTDDEPREDRHLPPADCVCDRSSRLPPPPGIS